MQIEKDKIRTGNRIHKKGKEQRKMEKEQKTERVMNKSWSTTSSFS